MTTGNGGGAQINVTPMIDILLVLLVIFMVVTPQLSKGLDANVPSEAASTDTPRQADQTALVVSVGTGGHLKLNEEPVELAGLAARLGEIVVRRGLDNPIFVRGDGDLEFQDVAQVLDIAKGTGARKVALMGRR